MKATGTDERATYEELESFLLASSEVAGFSDLMMPVPDPGGPGTERRQTTRVPCEDKYVELEGLDGDWIADSARVVNASPGGMCVEVFTPVEPGTMLMIWFETDAGHRRYALGLVVHRSRRGRAFDLGVQFTDSAAV